MDQLFTLAGILEGAWEYNLHMCFVDLVLREYGVRGVHSQGHPISIFSKQELCVYLEVSQNFFKWVLASARAVPCPQSCL